MLTDEALEKYREICYQQPQPTPPPRFDFENIRPASRASHRPQWMIEGRSLASRASSRASFTSRTLARRPTISTPYDFRKVEHPNGRTGGFRPLQLSIYLPGNELEPLPVFEEANFPDLAHPPKALVKSRSESILSRPSTSFTIPRKPVASRTVSLDGSRFSIDSHYTTNESSLSTRPRGPSVATSRSTQEFLDALDARLPQSPPMLRSKSGPEPIYTLYRRASEQSLRLRTHLEEREQIERRLPECDTILEEKQMDNGNRGLSPISSHDSPVDGGLSHEKVFDGYKLSHPTPSPPPSIPLPPLPTANSSSSLALPIQAPSPLPLRFEASTTDLLQRKLYTPAELPSVRARISQWLMRAGSQSSPNLINAKASDSDTSDIRPSTERASTSSSIYTHSHGAELASPWTTPRSSPHRKKSSLSSCNFSVPGRSMSFDLEKHPQVMEVGCAF